MSGHNSLKITSTEHLILQYCTEPLGYVAVNLGHEPGFECQDVSLEEEVSYYKGALAPDWLLEVR